MDSQQNCADKFRAVILIACVYFSGLYKFVDKSISRGKTRLLLRPRFKPVHIVFPPIKLLKIRNLSLTAVVVFNPVFLVIKLQYQAVLVLKQAELDFFEIGTRGKFFGEIVKLVISSSPGDSFEKQFVLGVVIGLSELNKQFCVNEQVFYLGVVERRPNTVV